MQLALVHPAYRIQFIPGEETPQDDQPNKPATAISLVAAAAIEKVILSASVELKPGDMCEFFASIDNDRTNAVRVGLGAITEFEHTVPVNETRWYWVRVRRPDPPGADVLGDFFPGSSTGGVEKGSNSVTDPSVTVEPADGSQAYASVTQPQIEVSGIGGLASYTAPSNISVEVLVAWSAQARISTTTSGTAVGTSLVGATVTVNGSVVWDSAMTLEGYTGADDWATFSGARNFSVPAGQELKLFLNMGRSFVTGGVSPAQTHYWQNALLSLKGVKA